MTLARAAFGQQTLLKQATMVLGGSLFIAVCAQVSIGWPVPMTLQTLAVLIVGLTFGARLGALTVLAYLAEGAMGLPVFANANNGAAFFGPTAGFLVGFVGMAWIAGLAADRGLTNGLRGMVFAALTCIAASVLLYVPGIAWPMALANAFGLEGGWIAKDFGSYYWTYFIAPFLVGDAIKAVLAAMMVTGGFAALKSRKG